MNEKSGKTGAYITFFFLTKIVTTEIGPSRVSDYLNKNNKQPFQEIKFTDTTVLLFHLMYQLQWQQDKLFREKKQSKYKRGVTKAHIRPFTIYKLSSWFKIF